MDDERLTPEQSEPGAGSPGGRSAGPGWLLQAVVVFLLVFILGLLLPVALSGTFPALSPGANSQTPATLAPSFEDMLPPATTPEPLDGVGEQPFIAQAPSLSARLGV